MADLGITADKQGSDLLGLDGAQNTSKRQPKTGTWPLERFNEVWETGVWKFRRKPRFYLVLGGSTGRPFSCLVTCILDTSKRLLFPAPKWGASFSGNFNHLTMGSTIVSHFSHRTSEMLFSRHLAKLFSLRNCRVDFCFDVIKKKKKLSVWIKTHDGETFLLWNSNNYSEF